MPAPRDTTTGSVLEQMVLPALARGGYHCRTQQTIGRRPGGRPHRIDAVATKGERQWLVSMKWQQVTGTAEQKVPFEVICLADALAAGGYEAAYLVLGGLGWTLREFYTKGGLSAHLSRAAAQVKIVTLEEFVALANRGAL
ncbi:MAG TPA: PD-(D/E)XK nuclease superfamily protein [Candidatus Polarisedimenticolia bacterium]|nr:PD-(D/E)XK nuclease superfamily protein [Candidatus Polarisedimenticolia bacterium]